MSRIIAVYGANGSGKSTVVSNLAYELSDKYLVGVISANMNYPSIQHFFGINIPEENSIKNICFSPNKEVEIVKQFMQHPNNRNLFILTVPNNSDCLSIADEKTNRLKDDDIVRDFWETLKVSDFDYIIVDCTNEVNNLVSTYSLFYANVILHTIKPTIQGLSFVKSYAEFINKMQNDTDIVKLINIANADENYIGLAKFENLAEIRFNIALPYDNIVRQAENEGVPVSEIAQKSFKSKGYVKAFNQLVNMVVGGM